jgi:hypothetical protein
MTGALYRHAVAFIKMPNFNHFQPILNHLQVVFSNTKAITAICVGMCVDRGLLQAPPPPPVMSNCAIK